MGLRMDDIHSPSVPSGPTTRPQTNGMNKKLTFGELSAQKERLEAELSALGAVLDSHGVNMNTSLTTFDGYPRADIDVAQIRTTRSRIIYLKTDYKLVMKQLEEAVHEHFATKTPVDTLTLPVNSPSSQLNQTATHSTQSGDRPTTSTSINIAFARVNSVVPGSPAAEAGLQAGDRIVRFGAADITNHERLSKVAQVVQQSENRSVAVRVLRDAQDGTPAQGLDLTLKPRRDWGGRGLLGCHLLPL